MKIYIASSLFNIERVQQLRDMFIEQGMEISYDWTTHGKLEDLSKLKEAGINETRGVVECDILFMVFPARNGSHVELGIAIALNKPVVILAEQQIEYKPFYCLDNIQIFDNQSEALDRIKAYNDYLSQARNGRHGNERAGGISQASNKV